MKKIRIKDCLKYISDYHSNGSYETLKKNVKLKKENDYAVMIRTLNFERKDFKDDLVYLSEDEYNFLSKSKVYPNDILVNKIANPGSVYLMPNLNTPVSCGMNLFVMRFDDTVVNQQYMFYNMKYIEPYIKSLAHGTTTKTITKDDIKNVELMVHTRDEQDKIAILLSAIDSKIEINNDIMEKGFSFLKDIYDYWFLQFDFPNENGKPYKSSGGEMAWSESLKCEIPKRWCESSIGDILIENKKSKIKVGEAKTHGKIPFFTSGSNILAVDESLVTGMNCYLNTGGNADAKHYYGQAAYSTDTWCVTAKEGLEYVLPFILDKLKPSMDRVFFQGTGLKHLQKKLLRDYKICIPEKKVLASFAEIAENIFKQEHNLLMENRQLESLKNFLLPLLMNGQVRV